MILPYPGERFVLDATIFVFFDPEGDEARFKHDDRERSKIVLLNPFKIVVIP